MSTEVNVELDPDDTSKIIVRAPYLKKDQIKNLPGSSFKGNLWRVPLSWPMCLALRATFNNDLVIGPELAAWAFTYKQLRIDPALALRNQLTADGDLSLYPHQRAGVLFLGVAQRALLCDGLGSGKTRTAFSTVKELHRKGEKAFPVLVVCPNSTKFGWQREIREVWPDLTITVIDGTATQRRKQLNTPSHVYIINWESVKSHSRLAPFGSVSLRKCTECGGADETIKVTQCQKHAKELNEIDFGTVIADEAHRMKDAAAQQTRALKAATGDAPFRFALTGTPIADAPDDLFSILNWLYPEAYPSKTKFIDRFIELSYNSWGGSVAIGIQKSRELEFFAGLDPIMRRMPTELILTFLPPVVKERRDVEMVPKQAKAYKQMQEQMIAELDDGKRAITTSPLTRMMRLLQLSMSYADIEWVETIDPDTGLVIRKANMIMTEPSGMLDAFMDDIDDFKGEHVAVFSPSKQLINLLSTRMNKQKIAHGRITGDEDSYERQEHMDRFQRGHTQFILCTSSAGGTGITLTNARIGAHLGRPWSNIEAKQTNGRYYRIGSEKYPSIIERDYVTRGTVQEYVFDALDAKNENLQTVLRDQHLLRRLIEEGNL